MERNIGSLWPCFEPAGGFHLTYKAATWQSFWQQLTTTPGPYLNERGEAHNFPSNYHRGTKKTAHYDLPFKAVENAEKNH